MDAIAALWNLRDLTYPAEQQTRLGRGQAGLLFCRMSEEAMTNVDLDVRRMRGEEILHRLRLAVNSMLKGCRICNRSATSDAAMVEHVRGNRHRDIIDSRAHRRTMLETTARWLRS